LICHRQQGLPHLSPIPEAGELLPIQGISAYLLYSAVEKANAELRAIETITLKDADRDAFFAALAAPPEPNAALRKFFAEGRRRRA